jgi:hypothetical protein
VLVLEFQFQFKQALVNTRSFELKLFGDLQDLDGESLDLSLVNH